MKERKKKKKKKEKKNMFQWFLQCFGLEAAIICFDFVVVFALTLYFKSIFPAVFITHLR